MITYCYGAVLEKKIGNSYLQEIVYGTMHLTDKSLAREVVITEPDVLMLMKDGFSLEDLRVNELTPEITLGVSNV